MNAPRKGHEDGPGAASSGCNARRDASFVSEIVGTGFCYPSDVVDNDAYFRRARFPVAPDHGALVAETRMKTRRWCLPEEDTATMTRAAVQDLLERHPELAREIDVVVVASGTTMTMAHPSDRQNRAFADLSPLVLRQLGRVDGLGLDIKACYCTGFLRGMQVVDGLLANPNYRVALLLATEQGSRFALAETNRSSFCFIVSDAAGAVAFRRVAPRARTGIVDELCRRLEWPRDKVLWSGDVTGFSGSASIPACLAQQIQEKRITKGQFIMSLAVGAGMNSAGALYFY